MLLWTSAYVDLYLSGFFSWPDLHYCYLFSDNIKLQCIINSGSGFVTVNPDDPPAHV